MSFNINFSNDKDIFILFFGRVLQTFLSLVAIRVITTFFSTDQIGNYYLILSIGFFFSYILLNPIAMFFSRHLVGWRLSKQVFNAFFLFFSYILVSSLIAVIFSYFLYYILDYQAKFELAEFLVVICFVVIISTTHRNLLTGINILQSRLVFIVAMIITLSLSLLTSVSLIYFYDPKAINWFYGILFAEFITLPFILNYFLSGYKLSFSIILKKLTRSKVKNVVSFSAPIALTNIFLWGQLYLYRIIVDYKYSDDVLGIIGVALAISTAVFAAVENIIMQYYYPIFLGKIHNASSKTITKAWSDMASKIIPIYILTALFVISMAANLLVILVDEAFHYVYTFTMIGVGIEFFRVMTNLLNQLLQAEYKTKLSIFPYFVGVMITFSLLLLIDFTEHLNGIIWVLTLGGFLIFMCMLLTIYSFTSINLNINFKKISLLVCPFLIYILLGINLYPLYTSLIIIVISCLYLLFAVVTVNNNSA